MGNSNTTKIPESPKPFSDSKLNPSSLSQFSNQISMDDETIAIVVSALLSLKSSTTELSHNCRKRPRLDHQATEEKKLKKRILAPINNIFTSIDPKLPPLWILRKVEEMKGTDLTMVMEKVLYSSDVSTTNCRFSMPQKQLLNLSKFLTEEEMNWLDEEKERPNSVPVKMIDTMGYLIDGIKIRKWTMNKSRTYNLVGGWNKFVKTNGLKKGMLVRVWSFRDQSLLCMAMARVDLAETSSTNA